MAAAGLCVGACAASAWQVSRAEHFELYSPAAGEVVRPLAAWFEQLRAFYGQQTLIKVDALPPLRLIVFASQKEYEPYRLRETSDAYYAGGSGRHYIVMAAGGADAFRIAAHEYSHFVFNANALRLPPWLNEGLAELLSTLRVNEAGFELGGELPAHMRVLKTRVWKPLPALLAEPEVRDGRESAAMFYAESWALAGMLLLSPDYSARFPQLMIAAEAGRPSLDALEAVFGKSAQAIESDLRAWVDKRAARTMRLAGVPAGPPQVQVSNVPDLAAQSVLADALMTGGELDRAAALYREMARVAPEAANISAALGSIALRQGDSAAAREQFQRAIQQGVTDANVCYHYAVLADAAGLAPEQIRPALERAVAIDPGFDDARYKLALLEKNTGHLEAALGHFRAMRSVAPARAFNYWIAMADTLNDLGRREEALEAAHNAAAHAHGDEERARAAQLAYFAQTDLSVQFARDSSGRSQMITTRVPHQTADWNPFVEAGDDLKRVRGRLREIDCDGGVTRIRVEAPNARLTLTIADPSRVRMRNAPDELVCGAQSGDPVTVEYAASQRSSGADGLVRGIEFTAAK